MAVPVERGPAARGAPPRIVNVILGIWLFISAFVWPHTQAQMTNTWILGVLCVIFALVAMAVPWARYLNTLLAISAVHQRLGAPLHEPGTIWNNVLVAIAVFIVSLVPSEPGSEMRGFFGRPTPPRAA